MRILIIGAGAVGFQLARKLAEENHDVTIVEENRERVRRLRDRLDVRVLEGSGGSPEILRRAGIAQSELVIAVTDRDELNLIGCAIAKNLGVPQTVARVRNAEYSAEDSLLNRDALGIDCLVNPVEITVESIAKIIKTPGATEVADFAGGKILLRGFHVSEDSLVAGKDLSQFKLGAARDAFLIVAIARGDELIIPKGKDRIEAGDDIFVLVAKDHLQTVAGMIQKGASAPPKVVIYDADELTMRVAKRLEKQVEQVVIIDPDQERAELACSRLARGLVLCGEPTEAELLAEARVKDADFFMGLSARDDRNVLSALFAKKHGASRTMVLTNEPDFVPVIGSIGIDVAINPRLLTVGEILRYVIRGNVVSVVSLREDKAEALELIAEQGSKIVGRELSKVKMPRGSLVGAINREGSMMIPGGDSVIRAGESVIVFALTKSIDRVERLFTA